jgi:Flp pilus assembly protein TadD
MRFGWLGGLLFVIHPLAVESVAWIAEIKNTLSLPFYLLACEAWLDAEEKKPWSYAKSILFYLAAMLAKTSTVMLPAVLLLYCWWKRGVVTRQESIRMIPFGVIAVTLGLVTVYFQNHGPYHNTVEMGGFLTRTIRAGTVLCFYLGKFILPLDLLPIYPRWSLDPPSLVQVLTLPALAVLLWSLGMERKDWARHALLGFGFFVLNLLPVLGWVRMQYLSFSWVADHLTYLPMIGLCGLVAAGWGQMSARVPASVRYWGMGAMGIVLAALAWASHTDARRFSDAVVLGLYNVQYNPQAWPVHYNLGFALVKKNRLPEAIDQFEQAIRINPDLAEGHTNMGAALRESGHLAEAMDQFEQALKIKPNLVEAHRDLGEALMQTGQVPEAMEQFRQVLQIEPDDAQAHFELGLALGQSGRTAEALEQFQMVVQINPGNPAAHFNLGVALEQSGRVAEAIGQYEETLRINPDDARARDALARAQAEQQPDAGKR